MNTLKIRLISWTTWPLVGMLGLLLATLAPNANAVPAYAQQTHMTCSACHVGAFGPQLTPFGRQFKLLGYSLKIGSGLTPKVSLRVTDISHIPTNNVMLRVGNLDEHTLTWEPRVLQVPDRILRKGTSS